MTVGLIPPDQASVLAPRWIAPICAWLAWTPSRGVTGQVFEVTGAGLGIAEGWHPGHAIEAIDDPNAIDAVVRTLLAAARKPVDLRQRTRVVMASPA